MAAIESKDWQKVHRLSCMTLLGFAYLSVQLRLTKICAMLRTAPCL